ncbi:MAG: (deoxy)nucleoside triphosphate pyrophosphohydrolase [Bacteroidaceae bacterium]|nr:(deoxy)nucleoside triphosphate pyrophosphohydrolase [Bacteroidaceae bacterium]
MKQIEVVAAIIRKDDKIFATQRGYGEWKDWWEFPGGKMEAGETPEEALKREIREELSTEISVDEFLCTVEYDYPTLASGRACSHTEEPKQALLSSRSTAAFHLTMHCYICSLFTEALHLNEHEAAKWLTKNELDDVRWLPADLNVIQELKCLKEKGQ